MGKSNARQIQDWLDLAADQGWRLRETKHGVQLYPPGRAEIITIHDVRRSDHVALECLRSQLKRAGLKFNDDTQSKEKPVPQPTMPSAGSVHSPSAASATPDRFGLIQQKIATVVTLLSEVEHQLEAIRADQAKLLQIRSLLKEL